MRRLFHRPFFCIDGKVRDSLILQEEDRFAEIAPLPSWSRETFSEAYQEAICLLDEKDPQPTLPSVRFAFDSLKKPMPKHLDLPLNAFNHLRSGFDALKLKVGHLDLNQAKTLVKQAPKVLLRLDFNRKWPLEKLLAFASYFQPSDFDYFEEPGTTLAETILFSQKTAFPIALDESIPEADFTKIPTLKALVVKPTLLGKVPIAPPGVELIFSLAYESEIGLMRIAELATKYNPFRPHGLDFTSYLAKPKMIQIEQGRLKCAVR